jgi:hypothetical protein
LRCAEHDYRGCPVIGVHRQAVQIGDERLGQFERKPSSSFTHQKRIQNLMPPERRDCHSVASGD